MLIQFLDKFIDQVNKQLLKHRDKIKIFSLKSTKSFYLKVSFSILDNVINQNLNLLIYQSMDKSEQ